MKLSFRRSLIGGIRYLRQLKIEVLLMAMELSLPETLATSTPIVLPMMEADATASPLRLLYVHGIKNKPPVNVLRCQWDMAIFEQEIESSRFAYWVNRMRHPTPIAETCASPDVTHGLSEERFELKTLAGLEEEIAALDATPEERAFLEELAGEMLIEATAREWFSESRERSGFIRWLTRAFLPDAHDFLFNQARHDQIERIFLDALGNDAGRVIVVAHSMGTIISYEMLRKLGRGVQVPLFLSLGSPLGLGPVERVLRKWSGVAGKLPRPAGVQRWVNVAAKGDVVSLDKDLADDFEGPLEDVTIRNRYKDPHASSGYLESGPVRDAIRLLTETHSLR